MGDYIKKINNYVTVRNGKKKMFSADDPTYSLGNTPSVQDNTYVKNPSIQNIDPASVKKLLYRSYIKKIYKDKFVRKRVK